MKTLILALTLISQACPPCLAQEELRRAREAAALGSEARALNIAMAGLQTAPGDRDLLLFAVELLPEHKTAHTAALAAAARASLEKSKDDFAPYLGLCKALRVSGRRTEAVAACRKALELDPAAYSPYRELALTYSSLKQTDKALETLRQGAEIAPACQPQYRLAKALEAAGDTAGARRAYKAALAFSTDEKGLDGDYYGALSKAGLKRLDQKAAAARALPAAPKPDMKHLYAGCLAGFREAVAKDNLMDAADLGEKCAGYDKSAPELPAELAPVLLRLGRYERSVQEYERAARLSTAGKAAAAALRVQAAEVWLRLDNGDKAAAQYRLAVESNPLSLEAQKGLAALMDARSDFKSALDAYDAVVRLEPSNLQARTRADELRINFMNNDQILEELRFRSALEPGQAVLQPQDIKLFRALRAAELSGGVEYVRERAQSLRGLLVEKKTDDVTKFLLTGAGYRAYVDLTTRDAIKFFEKQKMDFREIFKLRNSSGDPVFDKPGKLTPEGAEVWRKGQAGKKTWLLSYEAVQESPKAVQANKDIAAAQAQGYREISEPEYLWLTRATNCPEDVLKADPINLRHISDGARVRYLLCFIKESQCMNGINDKLPPYIGDYRDGRTAISESNTSTNFFGTGGTKKYRFCEKGRIWDGSI